jgi:hypothetical protein
MFGSKFGLQRFSFFTAPSLVPSVSSLPHLLLVPLLILYPAPPSSFRDYAAIVLSKRASSSIRCWFAQQRSSIAVFAPALAPPTLAVYPLALAILLSSGSCYPLALAILSEANLDFNYFPSSPPPITRSFSKSAASSHSHPSSNSFSRSSLLLPGP